MFKVRTRWNIILRIDMSLYSDTLSWFRANQSFPVLFLINAACLAVKQHIPISLSLVWPELKLMINYTYDEHANDYTTGEVHETQ
jgi:hypothetical protein